MKVLLIQVMLYYIVSLHQTTTENIVYEIENELYYIVSLHQTTTCTTYIISNQSFDYFIGQHEVAWWGLSWYKVTKKTPTELALAVVLQQLRPTH